GTDTLTAFVCDNGGACDSVIVVIMVGGPNNAPVIVDEDLVPTETMGYSIPEDMTLMICLQAIDADNDPLDIVTVINGPLNGTVNGTGDGDTCITYVPNADWNGPETFSAVVCDGLGGCDTVLVIIHIGPVNDAPVIVDADLTPIDTVETASDGTPMIIC